MELPKYFKSARPKYLHRYRTNFTREQLRELENTFSETQYPNWIAIEELASALHLDKFVIKTWFKNHRNRWKKQQKQTQPKVMQEAPNQIVSVEVEKTLLATIASGSPLSPGILGDHGPDIQENSGTEQPKGAVASICISSWDSQPYAPPWASVPCDIDQFVELYALPGEHDPSDFDQYLFPK